MAGCVKLALKRYGVSLQPRRTWLLIWSRVQNLQETQPAFAAIVQRHLDNTQMRIIQNLDTVLTKAG
eukprot:1696112-Amphidinium_carterae.1